MSTKIIYLAIVFEAKEGGYWCKFPDFHCCVTQGESLDEVIYNAQEALETLVGDMVEHGETLPKPSGVSGIKAKADSKDGEVSFVLPIPVYPPAKTERVNITTTGDKLARITDYAKRKHVSRSELMINATLEYIKDRHQYA